MIFRKWNEGAELVLQPRHEITRFGTRRSVKLKHPRLTLRARAQGAYFDINMELPAPALHDGLVFGFLHFAMKRRAKVRIVGRVSRSALRNALAWQESWANWVPDKYRPVEIIPDEIVADEDLPRPRSEAIGFFSGGIDATFMALRESKDGPAHYGLKHVVTVHGYDVTLRKSSEFEKLLKRTDPLLNALGISRIVALTNTKAINLDHWEPSFGAQMAALLHQFSDLFGHGLIASSEPYNTMNWPWGSTPMTDYLMSGGNFRIEHVGSGFSRTEKAGLIVQNPVAVAGLKVCWEGRKQGENCGHCDKCLRTRLNLLAVGLSNPACFPTPFDERMIDGMTAKNQRFHFEFASVLWYCKAHGVREPWVNRLEQKLAELGRKHGYPRNKSINP